MRILFHIGFHKTGTTWLQKHFFPSQPSLRLLCRPSEPWSDPLLSYLIATPAGKFDPGFCRKVFEENLPEIPPDKVVVVSAERLSGHPFSGGQDRFRIAERIYSAFPAALVLMVVREQREMLWSAYKLLVEEGYPGSLDELLDQRPWKGAGFDLSFYEYDLLADKYFSLFGRDNVLVAVYEKMRKDIERFLADVCAFVKVDFLPLSERTYRRNANAGLPNRVLPFIRFLNRFRNTELNQFPVVDLGGGRYANAGLHGVLIKQFRSLPPKQGGLSSSLAARIEDYYRSSNARLSQFVGEDLSFFQGRD